eukprot:6214805-Pleurochrysis_carterae.AAC.9
MNSHYWLFRAYSSENAKRLYVISPFQALGQMEQHHTFGCMQTRLFFRWALSLVGLPATSHSFFDDELWHAHALGCMLTTKLVYVATFMLPGCRKYYQAKN